MKMSDMVNFPPHYNEHPSGIECIQITEHMGFNLGNAVKYTRAMQNARIEIGGKREGLENLYYVRDNGIGFNMRYYDKLFGVFRRLHSDNEYEGTGIGLAIVKQVVERHGGRVWAEGKLNEGATFYFTLPVKEDSMDGK